MSTLQYLALSVVVNFLLQDWGALFQRWNIFIVGYQVSTVSGILCSCEFLVTGLGSIIFKMRYLYSGLSGEYSIWHCL